MITMTDRTVGEIAADTPAAIGVFERFGIDYCCGGRTPLAEACREAGITTREFEQALDATAAAPEIGVDWAARPLGEMRTHLVNRFHVHAREELETLNALAEKVLSVHGERHAELAQVEKLVQALTEDMLPHMAKEEMILFPYIDRLEADGAPGPSCFGSVANPVRVMMMEHESVGDILAGLRQITSSYAAPEDGCFSYRELYRRLAAFERETHEHIHLENNIYFPRALELEQRVTA